MKSSVQLLEVNALPFNKEHEGGMLKVNVGPFALIEGDKGYVLTNNECIHYVKKYGDEPVKLPLHWTKGNSFEMMPRAEIGISFDELRTVIVGEIEDLSKWVHYFGIKARMCTNYSLLQKSCKEIGAELDFPEWK